MEVLKPQEITEKSNKKLQELIAESKKSKKFYEAKQRDNKPEVRIRRFD